MAVEVWVRNPRNYIQEAIEVGATDFAWDRGFLLKYSIDPARFSRLYLPASQPNRNLLIGTQGTSEYLSTDDVNRTPRAVYPTWSYGDPIEKLISFITHPAGMEPDRYQHHDPILCARPGQEHRVVITDLPSYTTKLSKKFMRDLAAMQMDFPDCKIHVHGLYSYPAMFGLGFRSVDIDPRTSAQKGKVVMPHGKTMIYERAADQPKWVNLMGMRPSDLKVPRNRCIFNILSARWAAEHFRENVRWSVNQKNGVFIDPDDPHSQLVTDGRVMIHNGVTPDSGDKWLCNLCSIQLSCKFFREGAVCAVPESEPLELAHFFKTRDSDTIIDGLGTLLAAQTHRLKRAMADEDGADQVDPEVTKIINSLFDRGVKLAKLVDPRLAAAGAARINLSVDNRRQAINAASPQQLMAAVVQELVARGVRREDITPDMVMRIIEQPEDIRAKAIEAAAGEKAS